MFVFSFKNGNDDSMRDSFHKYYILLVEMKDFNASIDNKRFIDQTVKNKKEEREKLVEMSKNDHYPTGNLLHYLYHQIYRKLISIDLSRQANTSIRQQMNFVGKLEEDDGATIFFIVEKQQKTFPSFSLDSLIVTEQDNNGTSKNIKLIE